MSKEMDKKKKKDWRFHFVTKRGKKRLSIPKMKKIDKKQKRIGGSNAE